MGSRRLWAPSGGWYVCPSAPEANEARFPAANGPAPAASGWGRDNDAPASGMDLNAGVHDPPLESPLDPPLDLDVLRP
jgi:hypothetical protein